MRGHATIRVWVTSLVFLAPAIDRPSEGHAADTLTQGIAARNDPYAVPSGSADELHQFIVQLKQYVPDTPHGLSRHPLRLRKALATAAGKILQTEDDEWSEAYQTALRVLLEDRFHKFRDVDLRQQEQAIEFTKSFLTAKLERQIDPADVELAISAGLALEMVGSRDLAITAYGDFAELFAKEDNERLADEAELMNGAAQRLKLLGKPILFGGTTVDGGHFNWEAYRGRVVLVVFQATNADRTSGLIAVARHSYDLYQDRGFDVVEIRVNENRDLWDAPRTEEPVPWTALDDTNDAGQHPIAARFGATRIPMAFLVDREGNLISTRIHDAELDMTLASLLGPPYAPKRELTCIDLQKQANRALGGERADRRGTGNALGELPRGEQILGGVKFRIGEKYMQLAGQLLLQAPRSLTGISVDQSFSTLYMLHATEWGEVPWAIVADGTVVGHYRVHYEDESVETIPIVYGKHVRDWWDFDLKCVNEATVVWQGNNEVAGEHQAKLRLYMSVWENPRPQKTVTRIDFTSVSTFASPFCVAMTVETPSTP